MQNNDYQKNIYRAHLLHFILLVCCIITVIIMFIYGIVLCFSSHSIIPFFSCSISSVASLVVIFFLHYFIEIKIDQVEAQENYFLSSLSSRKEKRESNTKEKVEK